MTLIRNKLHLIYRKKNQIEYVIPQTTGRRFIYHTLHKRKGQRYNQIRRATGRTLKHATIQPIQVQGKDTRRALLFFPAEQHFA